jgi:hypothetical protein
MESFERLSVGFKSGLRKVYWTDQRSYVRCWLRSESSETVSFRVNLWLHGSLEHLLRGTELEVDSQECSVLIHYARRSEQKRARSRGGCARP